MAESSDCEPMMTGRTVQLRRPCAGVPKSMASKHKHRIPLWLLLNVQHGFEGSSPKCSSIDRRISPEAAPCIFGEDKLRKPKQRAMRSLLPTTACRLTSIDVGPFRLCRKSSLSTFAARNGIRRAAQRTQKWEQALRRAAPQQVCTATTVWRAQKVTSVGLRSSYQSYSSKPPSSEIPKSSQPTQERSEDFSSETTSTTTPLLSRSRKTGIQILVRYHQTSTLVMCRRPRLPRRRKMQHTTVRRQLVIRHRQQQRTTPPTHTSQAKICPPIATSSDGNSPSISPQRWIDSSPNSWTRRSG